MMSVVEPTPRSKSAESSNTGVSSRWNPALDATSSAVVVTNLQYFWSSGSTSTVPRGA